MTMSEEVWHLVIKRSGLSDRVFHKSLHVSPQSARNKAERVLTYDVPTLDEWYERSDGIDGDIVRVGYVLDRDEINSWPIRIEADKQKIRDDSNE